MNTCKLNEKCQIDPYEQVAMIISCMVHDIDHPGFSNIFLINSKNKLALRYNDKAVMESHSIALTFDLMTTTEELNILKNMDKKQWKRMREMMISMVISTDMSKHFPDMENWKKRLTSHDFESTGKDKMLCMSEAVHLADISNPTKPWFVCYKWIELLFIEFYH
jgi:hypothetical protein